jgi:hypothetical protein
MTDVVAVIWELMWIICMPRVFSEFHLYSYRGCAISVGLRGLKAVI